MFHEKKLKDNVRRSFQITIGLREGYDASISHTVDEVLGLIGKWMKMRMESGLPVITGGTLVPGVMVYAWNSEATGVKINQEEVVLFVGEINPLYSAGLSNDEASIALKSLAGFLGDKLNQTRMYLVYMDELSILESDRATHPTEKTRVELTPPGEEEHDWNKVVDAKPQGYLELNTGGRVVHGPVDSVVVDDSDNVVVTLKWAATTPAVGQPGFGKWENSPNNKVVVFPSLVVPFVIEETPEKGPRVRFGTNILYFNRLDGLDPAKVKGLVLG